MVLKLLDLFSGIGGFSYAAERIVGGYETTQFVEIDPYCRSVIRKNFPNTPIHDDIKTFTAKPGQFDVFTIGFPGKKGVRCFATPIGPIPGPPPP